MASTPSSASLRPQVLALLLSLALCSPTAVHSFWFASSRAKSQAPQWFGIRDYGAAAQAAYSYDSTGGVTVAVPVAVPLSPHQLQASPPYPGLSTVQLVPCLCPISKDPENVKALPPMSAGAPPPPMGPVHHMQSVPMQAMQMQTMQAAPAPAQQQQAQPSQHAQHPSQ